MVSALDVAWFFVVKGQGDPSVTQLKLQKLVYYAQGFYLAKFGKPLFNEEIQAWDYGPVVVELREQHRNRKAEPILPSENSFGEEIDGKNIISFLEKIWCRFGHYTAGQLVDMTHQETPWREAYYGESRMISSETMKAHFISRLNEIENRDIYADFKNLEGGSFDDLVNIDDSEFSQDFIDYSNKVAQKLASRDKPEISEDAIRKLAKSLAVYND